MNVHQQLMMSYPATAASSDWAFVTAQLNFVGAEGSSTITDDKGNSWTVSGNAHITTANPPPGCTSSLVLDGSGDWVQCVNMALFSPGTQDYTIQVAFRQLASKNSALIDAYSGGQGYQLYMTGATGTTPNWYEGTSVVLEGTAISSSTWTMMTLSRKGGTTYLFADATLLSSQSTVRILTPDATIFALGAQVYSRNGSYDCNAQIGPFRFLIGKGLYDASNPPSAISGPFPTS
ncbi:LamG domain-containing protein [Pseudomonas nitroreducens]|uniref:LamG-like jellyroll fold domain-containing protein n=1 Tax=Pseudomonas nitroreducens TaxID=46680 RepID=UPI0014758C28|nr:LamG-like jellyroll fold domain-containing protein [Pseudomonas nitroreducens]NMZ77659.1 LamG domain-containing protein [Pseudomonas nitroreducens]